MLAKDSGEINPQICLCSTKLIPCLQLRITTVHLVNEINIYLQVTFVLFNSPPAASLLPHRFVTVRRGSPAAKSGQIRPGDRLEAVEGRSVVTLPHRELAQILRRAGNTLRLTIVPRPSTCECRSSGHQRKSVSVYFIRHSSHLLSLLQILKAFQNPLSSTLVTEAERARGCVQR